MQNQVFLLFPKKKLTAKNPMLWAVYESLQIAKFALGVWFHLCF